MERTIRSKHMAAVVFATAMTGMAIAGGVAAATPSSEGPTFKGDAGRNSVGLDGPSGERLERRGHVTEDLVSEREHRGRVRNALGDLSRELGIVLGAERRPLRGGHGPRRR